jgi:hypothetical protein
MVFGKILIKVGYEGNKNNALLFAACVIGSCVFTACNKKHILLLLQRIK